MLLRDELGRVLREIRAAEGLTLRDVAARASVSPGYLSEIERGSKEVSSEVLDTVCAALGVDLSDVLYDVADGLAATSRGPVLAA